jgi:hypothetical protein
VNAKAQAARLLPGRAIERLDRAAFRSRQLRVRGVRRVFGSLGYNVAKRGDYYSPLPVLEDLERTRARWDRPSGLAGVAADLPAIRGRLDQLAHRWNAEFDAVTGDHAANTELGFGPGIPAFDARTLYGMLREHRPARYLEVGSGLSTYYASLAAEVNGREGHAMKLHCIEPFPFDALRELSDIELTVREVQDVELGCFEELDDGDVLFIDSSHALKVDSDVAYLVLEVLPRLRPGVLVHIHDVPFPYNTPFPADTWVFGERWPIYWNEAMVVQAFLSGNRDFEVLLSAPMVRHDDEAFLVERFPSYTPLADDPNPPSSLWLRRTAA